jgi:hypothetical protein
MPHYQLAREVDNHLQIKNRLLDNEKPNLQALRLGIEK